jgi:hypothetical protein
MGLHEAMGLILTIISERGTEVYGTSLLLRNGTETGNRRAGQGEGLQLDERKGSDEEKGTKLEGKKTTMT